jgi:hypothetical protein
MRCSKGKRGAKMVSEMAVSGSKRLVTPWFQKCILYLGMKAMLYCTSSTTPPSEMIAVGKKAKRAVISVDEKVGEKTCKPWYKVYLSSRR